MTKQMNSFALNTILQRICAYKFFPSNHNCSLIAIQIFEGAAQNLAKPLCNNILNLPQDTSQDRATTARSIINMMHQSTYGVSQNKDVHPDNNLVVNGCTVRMRLKVPPQQAPAVPKQGQCIGLYAWRGLRFDEAVFFDLCVILFRLLIYQYEYGDILYFIGVFKFINFVTIVNNSKWVQI